MVTQTKATATCPRCGSGAPVVVSNPDMFTGSCRLDLWFECGHVYSRTVLREDIATTPNAKASAELLTVMRPFGRDAQSAAARFVLDEPDLN